jgi:hypothetical protein
MARIRTIKPQFFTSEDVTALEPLARLLFVGLFTECDRDGRVEDRPRTLKMRLLPEDACDVDALLWSLVDGGLIRRYEAEGKQIIQVKGFEKHQKPHPKEPASLLPANGTERSKPCNSTAGREKVFNLPVDNPSTTARKGREGKEYGVSLREGEREPEKAALSRSSIQGSGAFEPGSLPRDHMRHALCGPSMRICLLSWQFETLAKAYNDPENAHGTRAVISQFIEQLESNLTPSSSIGPFAWVEKEFHTYLKAIGRTAPKIEAKPKPFSIQDVLDREAAKKAGAQ